MVFELMPLTGECVYAINKKAKGNVMYDRWKAIVYVEMNN